MRTLTMVAAATFTALSMTTALTTSPVLAQAGTPAAQPNAPQTAAPAGRTGTAPASSTQGNPAGGAANQTPQASASGQGTGSATAQGTERNDDQAASRPRRWYEAETERSAAESGQSFEKDNGDRGRGFDDRGGRRFGQADTWRYERDEEGRLGSRWNNDWNGDARGFSRFSRGESDGFRGWKDRDGGPRRGREGFRSGEGSRGGEDFASRGGQGARAQMMGAQVLARVCGPDAGARVIGRMLDRLEDQTEPTDAQRATFDRLVDAAQKARDTVRASCPTENAPVTLPGRVAAAEKRVSSILDGIRTIRPALDDFYGSLSEEQKARLYMGGDRENRGTAERLRDRRSENGNVGETDRWRDRESDGDRFGSSDRDDDRDGWLDDWRGPS